MRGNAKTLKRNNGEHSEILIGPSIAPHFFGPEILSSFFQPRKFDVGFGPKFRGTRGKPTQDGTWLCQS